MRTRTRLRRRPSAPPTERAAAAPSPRPTRTTASRATRWHEAQSPSGILAHRMDVPRARQLHNAPSRPLPVLENTTPNQQTRLFATQPSPRSPSGQLQPNPPQGFGYTVAAESRNARQPPLTTPRHRRTTTSYQPSRAAKQHLHARANRPKTRKTTGTPPRTLNDQRCTTPFGNPS